ncbi:hypothetical protein [Streptomyces sp. NPDC058583]|uniref:hypothetical protein n=1 Tax=unclassified Streptomyces TaxID=2593676 RepID=UPI0036650C14
MILPLWALEGELTGPNLLTGLPISAEITGSAGAPVLPGTSGYGSMDNGGRFGRFLIAQMTERWGTRYEAARKII